MRKGKRAFSPQNGDSFFVSCLCVLFLERERALLIYLNIWSILYDKKKRKFESCAKLLVSSHLSQCDERDAREERREINPNFLI